MGIYYGSEEKSTAKLRAAAQQHPRRTGKQIHAETTIEL